MKSILFADKSYEFANKQIVNIICVKLMLIQSE